MRKTFWLCALLVAFVSHSAAQQLNTSQVDETVAEVPKIKVFVLAGQSNAQGHGELEPVTTPGTLAHCMAHDSLNEFGGIHDGNGNVIARQDVWVRYDHENGTLLADHLGSTGFGGYTGQIGPDLGMGHVLGDYFNEKVLIIKTCWGGKSLAVDFRPPSSGGTVGPSYTQMITDINTAITNIATEFPDYNGEIIELAGFVWFQGWNDLFDPAYRAEYQQNLINLISDVRSDLNVPDLPVVVGLTGNGGYNGDALLQSIQASQMGAAQYPGHQHVTFAETRDFWREPAVSPYDLGHHWNNNAESYLRIGDAFGKKLIELMGGPALCGPNQVEVKVEISTDAWGGETSWTLTNLAGAIILQGGQGGVYANNTLYADSICVPADACIFFNIYDSYGDGIFAPNGYKLYVNDLLIASGADDIGSYDSEIAYCSGACDMVADALSDLQGHLNGAALLTPAELTAIRNTITQFPFCLADNEAVILLGKNNVEMYDTQFGPLFMNAQTLGGFYKDTAISPGLELERAMLTLQQGIFDQVFTPNVYAAFPQHLHNWKFNFCTNFPGYVDPPADSSLTQSVLIRANFADPEGANPYFDLSEDGLRHALRPTGLYLAPGSIVSVTVPDSLVGRDYWVRVGSHDWDLSEMSYFRRMDRISKRYPIDSTTIQVFNPLGGAISILVPYGADDGIVEVSVTNGVEAPFFSLKTFYETPDFDAELSKPGPWAVFESDNVMFTIPKHAIVPGQYDLKQTLQDWENALRGMNSILARQIIPDKHNMYQIADVDIRVGVYSIGYPMSNTPLNYQDVPGPAYFLNGPGPDDDINFHEMGHALAISSFPGEAEALVNFPYIMALNYGLNEDLDEAVKSSFGPSYGNSLFDIDKSVANRLVSRTFGSERDISNTTKDEVRYQHRGYGHYFEIVNILGWCPLRNFWKQEYINFENTGIDYVNSGDIDSRIIRMSVAAQADLRPLFHVFGILSQDSIAVQDTLAQLGIQPSLAIYNRLQAYFDLIPEDSTAFVNYALSIHPNLYTDGPTADPDYGPGWHYLKSLVYNETEAQQRTAILQSIIDRYYPNGAPTDSITPDVCCLLDTLSISLVNGEVVVTGGVKPYEISTDTTGNVRTVTVVDFDGCESTVQYTLTGLEEHDLAALRIYPNPASTEIYVELTDSRNAIESLRIVSMQGQVMHQSRRADPIDITALSEGVYILQIELTGGALVSKPVVVLKPR
ncbi:MAG: sialate O-acetylesterase [Bacteroidia bacterium]|nr:sialate O-acetylesterase [Bacteroidia bacterium]